MDLERVTIRRCEDLERTGSRLLVRRSLGIGAFGVHLVEIPPGERIPERDETRLDDVDHGDEPAAVLMVSAPRTSGYEPLEWA
jgi:hypothetical protein